MPPDIIEETKELSKTCKFTLINNNYSFDYPNVSQYLDIENLKITLSNGGYALLVRSKMKKAELSLDLIDAIAILTILCPTLSKDMTVSLLDLSIPDAMNIIKVYRKMIAPWFSKWDKVINSFDEDDKEE